MSSAGERQKPLLIKHESCGALFPAVRKKREKSHFWGIEDILVGPDNRNVPFEGCGLL